MHFLPALVGSVEILSRSTFRVTRDADLSLTDDADDLVEAVETQLVQRRFGDVVRVEVGGDASAGAPRHARRESCKIGAERVYVSNAPARARRTDGAHGDRPAGSEGQALGGEDQTAVREQEPRRSAGSDPAPGHSRPPSVRRLRHQRRGVRGGRTRSEGRSAQGHRLPDRRAVGHACVTRRDGRRRETGGLPRRAQGAFRRAAEHRVVESSRTGRRRRRLRRPPDEGACQAHAARPS